MRGVVGSTIYSRFCIGALIVVCIVLAECLAVVWPSTIQAADPTRAWSWSVAKPTVFDSSKIDTIAGSDFCTTSYQLKEVAGAIGAKQVCVAQNDHTSFGMYFTGHGFQPVISFGYDTQMYKVVGAVCEQSLSCRYLPETDTLVTSQNLINNTVRSLVVYKNLTKRLTKILDPLLPYFEYQFDSSNPDYVFRSSSGYAYPVGGFGASDDGKWLAVEIRQRGIGLLNIETFEMTRISTLGFYYGYGFDPASELAVSSGGRHVAVTGMNAGFTLFDVDPGCGDSVIDDPMTSGVPLRHPCKVGLIDTEDFISRFRVGSHPRYNDDGSELRFYASSYTQEVREVVLRAAGYVNQRVDYLALGDSYSSGEGETDDRYYLDGTNDKFEKCHISTRSYPFVIARTLGIESQYMKSVACSGAVTGDVVGSDESYFGQGGRLADQGFKLSDTFAVLNKSAAKETFIPGRVHQIAFVKQYQPKVITIGIGGNDAGFMDKLSACIGPGTCSWADSAEDREKTAVEVMGLFTTLVNTYTAVHDASPRSKLYAIGYPKIIDSTSQCSGMYSTLFNQSERKFMNEGIVYINQVVAAAAQKVGIRYIDIETSFGNTVLCGTGNPSAMNGIRTGDDSSLSDNVDWAKVIGQEGFHPRSTGHALTALQILSTVPNILTYTHCQDGAVVCPVGRTAPDPSSYWLGGGSMHNYARQHVASFTKDRERASNNRQKTIGLPSYSFAASSNVRVQIHSDPVTLGSFTSDGTGGVNFDVDLPNDLTPGFHTIHLYGTSFSGEQIDLYQVIMYQLPIAPLLATQQQRTSTNSERTLPATGASTVRARHANAANQSPVSSVGDVLGDSISRSSIQPGVTPNFSRGVDQSDLLPTTVGSTVVSLVAAPVLILLGAGVVGVLYIRYRRHR